MQYKCTMLFSSLLLAGFLQSVHAADKHHDHHHGQEEKHEEHQGADQHESHVHGLAILNLALDDSELTIEFNSPAANIVGFEHAPHDQKEKDAVVHALNTLKDADQLFSIPGNAQCSLTEAHSSSTLEQSDDNHLSKKLLGDLRRITELVFRFGNPSAG